MVNILFIYAKLHRAVRYVQGMNELLGTLYYVFASDENENMRVHAEADSFFCFAILMAEMSDLFIQTMDHTAQGIQGRMRGFIELLKRHDPEVDQRE